MSTHDAQIPNPATSPSPYSNASGQGAAQSAAQSPTHRGRARRRQRPPKHNIHYFQDIPGSTPGTLNVTSDVPPSITLIDYGPTDCQRISLINPTEIAPYIDTHSVSWVDLQGLGNEPTLQQVGQIFKLHPLVLEDVVNVPQRPKVEEYDDQLLVIARMVLVDRQGGPFTSEQISFILGDRYLLSIQEESESDCFTQVRDRILAAKGNIRKMGADYLLYALVDAIIDGFFPVLEEYGEQLELLEDEVVANPSRYTLERIHRMKRELLTLRRAIWPQRDAINSLIRDESDLISHEVRIYLRDCYDHTVQVLDMVETYREVASSLMDIYLSSVSNKMNEIMKFLTVMSSIFIPLTFIAGVYGMNFENMPELHTRSGYFVCVGVMAIVAIVLLTLFWRRGWFANYSTMVKPRE
jgi:magnesium transporter